MSAQLTSSNVVDQYLNRLRHALRHVRKNDRDDYITQISDHLNEARDVEELDVADESLAELIRRVGSPEALAREFYAAGSAKLNALQRTLRWLRRWWGIVGVVVILLAIIPTYAWASNYQPLITSQAGGYSDTVVALSGTAPVKLTEGDVAPVTWKLTHGRYRVSILFDATNVNSLPVNVSTPQLVPGWPHPVTWHLQNNGTGDLTPFRSTEVKGDNFQEVLFSETYVCSPWPKGSPNAGGESTFVTSLPIVESFWGFQHTVQLAVQPFYLEFAGNCFGG